MLDSGNHSARSDHDLPFGEAGAKTLSRLCALVVDDHPLVRSGLVEIIRNEFRNARIDEAGSGEDALAILAHRQWSVIILDISLPGKDGFAVLQEIRPLCPSIPVIMVSVYTDSWSAGRARELGACGYVPKGSAARNLARAIRAVLAGNLYFSDPLPAAAEPESGAPKSLSARENMVMKTLAGGKSIRAIAEELHLSEKTVATYKRRVLNKLRLESVAELVRYMRNRPPDSPRPFSTMKAPR